MTAQPITAEQAEIALFQGNETGRKQQFWPVEKVQWVNIPDDAWVKAIMRSVFCRADPENCDW